MKKLLLLLFVLLPFETSAQNFVGDGSKYDAYCKARLETRIFLGNYDRTLFYTFLYEKRDFQRQGDRSRPNQKG